MTHSAMEREHPTPAAVVKANVNRPNPFVSKSARDATTTARDVISEICGSSSESCSQQAGALPKGAAELSDAARGLLLRFLERDPQRRLRSVRQLQQTAFYMGYKFDDVRVLKIIPRMILERYFPDGPHQVTAAKENVANDAEFISFDQATIV